MFGLHSETGARAAGQVAEPQVQELGRERSSGPLDGELLDLYGAILIVVPLALVLKAFLF